MTRVLSPSIKGGAVMMMIAAAVICLVSSAVYGIDGGGDDISAPPSIPEDSVLDGSTPEITMSREDEDWLMEILSPEEEEEDDDGEHQQHLSEDERLLRRMRREDAERRRARRDERRRSRDDQRRDWFVRSVSFSGNEAYKKRELVTLMELRPRWPRYNSRFTNFLMNSDLEALRAFYVGRGFEFAQVKLEGIDRDSVKMRVRIRISINEGPQIHVSEVNVISERVELRQAEMKRIATAPGEPLIHADLRQDSRALREIMGRRGFLAAEAVPDVLLDSAENLARVDFNVREGPKAAVGEIFIDGYEGVRRSVLRREIVFRKGDTLTLGAIQQSERRLYSTNLFNYVHIRPMFDTTRAIFELPDSIYDVHVFVSLSEFYRLQGLVGYSTDEGFMTAATATYMNMFGRGQPLTLDAKVSQVQQSVSALYTIPGLLFMPFSYNTRVYYNRYDKAEHYRGAFRGLRLSIDQRADYHFLYQIWVQWEWLQWLRVPEGQLAGGVEAPEYATQSIGGNIGYDTRDNLFSPTRGSFTNVEAEFAGLFGGNYNQFVKLGFDARRYFSYRSRYFLSTAFRTGWVTPYGNSEAVPIQSRFYGGGGSTVRGFPVNKLAVTQGDLPLVGNFYTFFNIADIRFPIWWWINGAVFLDAGNVWSEFSDIESVGGFVDDLRWAAGPGLRIDTPIKLVARLDWGFKLDRRPGESRWELHFDLGQPF